jgi:hypothetical protein
MFDDGAYEFIDPEFEYLDLSSRNYGFQGVLDVLQDMTGDRILKQVNLSYNIEAEEFRDPKNIVYFIKNFKRILSRHKSTLTAIDLAGNNLFRYHAHPTNEHTKNYQVELTTALLATKITHIDLSATNITGNSGRELMGLSHMMRTYMMKGHAFKVKLNNLTSQGFAAVSECLGPFSSMTYLDVSCNSGGLDPLGRQNSEGVAALATSMKQSLHMRVFKAAENHLVDDDFVLLSDALAAMPQFQDLDLSSNQCRTNGARALKLAIISHSIFADDR